MTKTTLINLFELLTHLNTPDGIQASSGELYRGAIFGRDSLRVALDLLPWLPSIGEQVIFSLVRYQGIGYSEITEEEPGRIHHEYRHQYVGGRKIGSRQQNSLDYLSAKWGGNGKEVIYYGSIDATPQFIRLVCQFCVQRGREILEEPFLHRSGKERTLKEAVLDAAVWLNKKVEASELQLLEFENHNPKGLFWHVMRDGKLSYIHENGKLANRKMPIASLEVQGLAYDALIGAADLFEESEVDLAVRWRKTAENLQRATLEQFWQEERQEFAMAIDRTPKGVPRKVTVTSSVMGDLLESAIFKNLPEKDQACYVGAIVKKMYSEDFLTPVGIRNRSLRYADLVPLWDYHGSFVSWTVITNIFALGLRNYGLSVLAEDMENRLVNAAEQTDSYLEFFYVDKKGVVFFAPQQLVRQESQAHESVQNAVLGTNLPENIQAWTVSGLLRILLNRSQPFYKESPKVMWQEQVEADIRANGVLWNAGASGKPTYHDFNPLYVDVVEGRKAQEAFIGLM